MESSTLCLAIRTFCLGILPTRNSAALLFDTDEFPMACCCKACVLTVMSNGKPEELLQFRNWCSRRIIFGTRKETGRNNCTLDACTNQEELRYLRIMNQYKVAYRELVGLEVASSV